MMATVVRGSGMSATMGSAQLASRRSVCRVGAASGARRIRQGKAVKKVVTSRARTLRCDAAYAEVAGAAEAFISSTLSLSDPQAAQLAGFLEDPKMVAAAALALGYGVLLPPNLLLGYLDLLVASPVQSALATKFSVNDFDLTSQLGKGNFGSVFQSYYIKGGNFGSASEEKLKNNRVVIKLVDVAAGDSVRKDFLKRGTMARGAAETGIAEGYCNALMSRTAPNSCARFLGEFVADETKGKFKEGSQYLVWKYESDATLADFIENKVPGSFPLNLAGILCNDSEYGLDTPQQTAVVTQKVCRSMFRNLSALHKVGIVHRDVKPSNLLITVTGGIKFIDLGAATDLRTGINFNPRAGMLDPEYAPPEELVVPESTPRAPTPLLAIALAPAFWVATAPDRFDTFSVGMIMLQMAVPEARTFTGLRALKRELKMANYDMDKWRQSSFPIAKKADLTVLDLQNGAGWDLVKQLVTVRTPVTNRGRLSADEALRHRFFRGKAY